MKRVLAVLALGAAAALLGTGCGGGGSKALSKTDYVTQMTAIGKGLSTSLNTLGTATTAKTAATGLTQVQVDLRAAVKKIDAITPPADVKAAHEQLSKAVSEFADELDPIIAKLKGGNVQALTSIATLKGLKDIQAAAAAITKAGYKIGG
jgi:hypothetical protein